MIAFLVSGSLGCGDSESAGATGVPDAGSNMADGAPEAADAAQPDGSHDAEHDAPAETSVPDAQTCVPQPGPDLPDDAFEDTNCDGIDGDAAEAVFVSPSGDDTAAGTIGAPVASLLKAVELAVSEDKAVYVCNATYSEALHLGQSVKIYGGYDCSNDWQRTNDRAWAVPPNGSALVIEDVDGPVEIERMGFRAADAYDAGGSSVAARIVRSSEVRLNRNAFEAGDGANGTMGAQVSAVSEPAPDGEAGESLPTMTCSKFNPVGVCGSSGKGGDATLMGQVCTQGGHGGDGANVIVGIPQGAGEQGFPAGAPGGAVGHAGTPGGPGEPGTVGAASQDGIGSLDEDAYVPSNRGGNGGVGKPGKAGGGGSGGLSRCEQGGGDCSVSSTFLVGGGGGQGGLGGCGGEGGKGGGGGGASIGLLVIDSVVELSSCSVTSGDGGVGGSPSAGAAGQQGGDGGPAGTGTAYAGNGFAGGPGGNGGPGGSGGPGGGGPSLGLLVSGTEPTVSPTTLFDIGLGGDGGKGIAGADGADGMSAETFTLGGF